MTTLTETPDIADLLNANGTLHLTTPQTASDVHTALSTALDALYHAYRVAYNHTNGNRDDETVDSLDMATHIVRDLLDTPTA